MAIKGIILDVDGTLVDSNDAHAAAFTRAFAEKGISVPYAEIRSRIGMGGKRLVYEVSGLSPDSRETKELTQGHGEIFMRDFFPHLKAFPKTRELLLLMKEKSMRLVVGSSAKKDHLKPLLDLAGAEDLIEDAVSSSDVKEAKPAPDIILASLKKLGLQADEVLLLGDTPYDVESAARAGVKTVALRCGGWDEGGLKGAIAFYDDPQDLLARFGDSPFTRES